MGWICVFVMCIFLFLCVVSFFVWSVFFLAAGSKFICSSSARGRRFRLYFDLLPVFVLC